MQRLQQLCASAATQFHYVDLKHMRLGLLRVQKEL